MSFSEIIEKKIISTEALKYQLAIWRMADKKIVFTNGCFDLLHAGHVHLLSQARAFGHILIVGLNSDASVSRIKPGRPLQNQQSRALVLAAMEWVDAVVLYEEATPLKLIEFIQPDVLVKGSDYKLTNVVGREFIETHGGKVELVQLLPGFSTSAIIEKIKNG